jgi:hypothetical protein
MPSNFIELVTELLQGSSHLGFGIEDAAEAQQELGKPSRVMWNPTLLI